MGKVEIITDGSVLRIPYTNDSSFSKIVDASVNSNYPLYEMERTAVTMDNVYLEVVK